MVVGTASHLNAVGLSSAIESLPFNEMLSRAYWSVFVLETIQIPLCLWPSADGLPGHPPSPPLPVNLPARNPKDWTPPDTESSKEPSSDVGINGHFLRLVSLWRKVKQYLRNLHQGQIEQPWVLKSTHMMLTVELFQFDAQLHESHLFGNLGLSSRTAAEVDDNREYWNPWLAMQMLSHALAALLNHPFVHLIVLRSTNGSPQPRLFLQQTVDMALYHAGWLARLLRATGGLLDTVDPLIGEVVAAAATIPWIFQFAKDSDVAHRAQQDVKTMEAHLRRTAEFWPHLSQQV